MTEDGETGQMTGPLLDRRGFFETVVGAGLALTGLTSSVGTATADGDGLIWEFETDDRVYSSPAVADGTVYIGSDDGNLYAVDSDSGQEEWRFQTDDWVDTSPAVRDGTVYVGSRDSNLYAVDAETGQEEWRFQANDWAPSSPAVMDGIVYVRSGNTNL